MIRRIADVLTVVLTATLLLVIAGVGIDIDLGFFRLRVHDWLRPVILLVLVLAGCWAVSSRVDKTRPSLHAHFSHLVLVAVIVAAFGVYIRYQVRVAGGLDSYGYVSTAQLIASGRLSESQPLARTITVANAMEVATPLGHVPSADGDVSVPRFPIGLPLVMGLLTRADSDWAFAAPLLMAAAALFFAYKLAGPSTIAGLFGATVVAVNPLFAAYALQPMSDVPATCWLLGAAWLALQKKSGVAAGVGAGMAVLTRPALLPAALVLLLASRDDRGWQSTTGFAAALAVLVGLQAFLNAALYGGVTASGYGTASHMFDVSAQRLGANIANFGKWLTYSHTPLFWLAWPLAMMRLRHEAEAWKLSLVAAAAAFPYLFYIVFDDWESSRFLLPSIALILILLARAVGRMVPAMAVAVLVLVLTAASHRFLEREGIYRLASLEAKYQLVGEWFKNNTSDRAVVFASLHSGSIRMYGARQTLRWDLLPSDALASTVRELETAAFEPYLALDLPSEPPAFEERFSGQPVRIEQIARVRVVNLYRLMSAN